MNPEDADTAPNEISQATATHSIGLNLTPGNPPASASQGAEITVVTTMSSYQKHSMILTNIIQGVQ